MHGEFLSSVSRRVMQSESCVYISNIAYCEGSIVAGLVSNEWNGRDVEGSGCGTTSDSIQVFVWIDWGILRKPLLIRAVT